ncbi:MAG: alpha/beta fold hydrolase [Acidimicrobiia bacterium]
MAQPATEWEEAIERRGASGEAVVLIHGFSGHPGHWLPLADALSERGHTVVAPRLPGHGTSPEDLAARMWPEWLYAVEEVVSDVGDHRHVHLVGLSMGGMLAILTAASTAAASVTTINAPVVMRDPKVFLAPLLRLVVPATPAKMTPVPDPTLEHLWRPYPVNPTSAVAELMKVVRKGWRAAGRLRRPALVIQSRTDEIVHPFSGRLLAGRLDGQLMWLEDARHNAILDPSRHLIHRAILDQVENPISRRRRHGSPGTASTLDT